MQWNSESSLKGFTQEFIEVTNKIASLYVECATDIGAGRIDSRQLLVNLVLRARTLDVIATNKSRVWRSMWALSGLPGSSSLTGPAKNSIWAVIEKQLCRERLLLLCAMDPRRVAELNKIAEDDTDA